MAKRVLAIGVGGSGKSVLTILKERLEESYGLVPSNVVLLSLDTDSLRDVDEFAGTQLSPVFDDRGRLPEFQHVVSPGGMTMDTVFADITSGKTAAYMNWLEKDKLDRILGPAERDIRGGAQQRRPVGRTALFLRWTNPIYQSIHEAINRVYGEPEDDDQAVDAVDIEKGKRLIFIVGSVAGGTGSGFLIDVANLVRRAIDSNPNWQSLSVSAIIVLPDAFAAYTTLMDDPTNLKPNSYAALRELDRFTRVHSTHLPYMIRYGEGEQSITWSTNQPLDHIYLVDTASRSAAQDFDLGGDPLRGVFPVISDFIMSHIDQSLGDALATLRSNAGMHYDKGPGRMYSSFNVMTYIFPVDDVIESFAYRFLRETLARQFLPPSDVKVKARIEQQAQNETERKFTENSVSGKVNPALIQKAIACTRRIDPERPDVSWPGLFSLISLSDSAFAEDYQDLDQSIAYLAGSLIPSKEGEYKKEDFADGFTRLLNFSDHFMDEFLGPQIDADDEESRFGGDWDKILARYRDALRDRFSEALDAALLEVINRRDQGRVLEPSALVYARAMAQALKDQITRFRSRLEEQYREQQVDVRLRQLGEDLRQAITWMNNTKHKSSFLGIGKAEAQKAQEGYIGLFVERMELLLHQRIYRTVLDVLDTLGAAEHDSAGQLSVVDTAGQELENWELTMRDVDRIIRERIRRHEANRGAKKQVKVRRYLTSPEFEDELYRQPEHFGTVAQRVLGQVGSDKGITWQRLDEVEPLNYKIVITWGEEAEGAEKIAQEWITGAKNLFQVVRDNVTVAERVCNAFTSPASFAQKCLLVEEPFLRYNPSENDVPMFRERYVSFNQEKAQDDARKFLSRAQTTLRDQGINVDPAAESTVACTVVEVSRGVKLGAVEQYKQCHPEYRTKLNKGRESLHLFPEEQVATVYEQSIRTLGETDNVERALVPELVVAMGDPFKLKAYVLACAYRLIDQDIHFDPDTGQESTELFLTLRKNGTERRLALSRSQLIRRLEPPFTMLPAGAQFARLHLDALQNFMLKATEIRGITPNMIARQRTNLIERGASMGNIENPFTLSITEVNNAIRQVSEDLGPDDKEQPNRSERTRSNARRRLALLEPYVQDRVSTFKGDPDQRIKDLGTVMHLILKEEIGRLREMAQGN